MRSKAKSFTTLKSTFMTPESTDFSNEAAYSNQFGKKKFRITKWMEHQDHCYNNLYSESLRAIDNYQSNTGGK
jgi:hypothetical protein